MHKKNIVLDLDDVLLHEPRKIMTDLHQYLEQYTAILCDHVGNFYILPAYFDEFMRYCADNFNISFFSSGDKQRNECIVEKIWQKVFHCTKPPHVIVLSRNDKTPGEYTNKYYVTCSASPKNTPTYGTRKSYWSWVGNTKKDITKIGALVNTILVDDDPSYVLDGQIKNYLDVNGHSFAHILKDCTEGNIDNLAIESVEYREKTLSFYKLLHIVGVIETAKVHDEGIVEGLAAIYFVANKPFAGSSIVDGAPKEESKHREIAKSGIFAKIGHKKILEYVTNNSYPKLEILENLITA